MATIKELKEDYQRYKWFVSSTGNLIIGGKSAQQNDELLNKLNSIKSDLTVMHTASPGSPFSVILSEPSSLTNQDIIECATFTACFSQDWKRKKSSSQVHIFNSSQLYKATGMKQGTWGVKGSIKKVTVPLQLVLAVQKKILRAVPIQTIASPKKGLIKLVPGNIDKKDMPAKLSIELSKPFSTEEILSALPSGKMRILSQK